jgi:hypothetical protein
MPGTTGFRLDDEQRKQVYDCLKKAGTPLIISLDKFIGRLESSIDHFRTAMGKGTLREAHNALTDIARLSRESDPSPALLRVRLSSLPPKALEHVGRRARVVVPRLFPGDVIDGDPFEPPERFAARFLAWAAAAPPDKLVMALRTLSTDGSGGRWVKGKSRGHGKRSARRFEWRIFGVVRGAPEAKPEGGRPSGDARQELVMHLALDWRHATGQTPKPGRSGATGFGDLVHSVFQWLLNEEDDGTEAATYALRKYWDNVRKLKRRPPLNNFLAQHGEKP